MGIKNVATMWPFVKKLDIFYSKSVYPGLNIIRAGI